MDMTGHSAAVLLRQLVAGLEAELPTTAQYAVAGNCLTLATVPGDGDPELRLKAPDPFVAAVAGTAILLSFRAAGSPLPERQSGISILGFLDDKGIARFRSPVRGTVTGIRVPAQVRHGTIELPALDKHAPSAATAEVQEHMRQSIVLRVPRLTLTVYETPDGRLCVAGEGPEQPGDDMALLITTTIGSGPPVDWALFLRWSPVMGAVYTVLTIGRARQGLVWAIKPPPVLLAEVPSDVLLRSRAAADEHSGSKIAEVLGGRR
jgi:hypothetical protein